MNRTRPKSFNNKIDPSFEPFGLNDNEPIIDSMKHYEYNIKQYLGATIEDWNYSFSSAGHSQREKVRSNMMTNIDELITEAKELRDFLQSIDYNHIDKELLMKLLKSK